MWIRSQDKEILKECKYFYFFKGNGGWFVKCPECILGEYSSKEKALKVLDMIQNKIQYINLTRNINILNIPKCELGLHIKNSKFVFIMPQDDEV